MFAVTGTVPLFVAVNALIFPVPLAARPIEVLSLVQLKDVAPAPEKLIASVSVPLHLTWFAG